MQPAGEQTAGSLPQRERRHMSGRIGIEELEIGQQLTTSQALEIIDELLEADREFRRTVVKKPEAYRPGYRRGD